MSATFKQRFGLPIVIGALLVFLLGIVYFAVDPLVRRDSVSHYRLTAEFEVDGRTVTASQVYGYNCLRNVPILEGGGTHVPGPCNLRGEALRADFSSHGSVFILMNAWTPDGKALAGHDALVRGLLTAQAQRKPVPLKALPVMVHFKDPNDPKSIEAVDPAHLDRSFGSGVKLVGVRVTTAYEATQYGRIAQVLPWLATLKGDRLDRDADPASLAYRLYGFDFMWAG